MSPVARKLHERITSRTARKGVVGGYLGLRLAVGRNIDCIRESPALDVMGVLHGRGARVTYTDPHVPRLEARAWAGGVELSSVPLTAEALAGADCVVILTDHTAFDYTAIVNGADLVVDTRNAVKTAAPHVFRIGAPAADKPRPATEPVGQPVGT